MELQHKIPALSTCFSIMCPKWKIVLSFHRKPASSLSTNMKPVNLTFNVAEIASYQPLENCHTILVRFLPRKPRLHDQQAVKAPVVLVIVINEHWQLPDQPTGIISKTHSNTSTEKHVKHTSNTKIDRTVSHCMGVLTTTDAYSASATTMNNRDNSHPRIWLT